MPEGDTIFRAATQLRRVLQGQTLTDAQVQASQFDVETFRGSPVQSIEARGKHLLITIRDHSVVHTHLGMTGSWHVYRVGEPWRKPAHRAHVRLETQEMIAVCFSPKLVELLTPAGVRGHRFLRRLGPDLLATSLDEEEVLRRFRLGNRLTIGEAIMNQTIVSGVGNIYKSEVLFLEQLNPFALVEILPDEVLLRVVRRGVGLMRRNVQGGARTTRFRLDGQRHWVYGRSGKPCLRCGAMVLMRRQGDLGRSTYWCPACQAQPLLTPP